MITDPLCIDCIALSVETQKKHAETYTNVNNLLNIDYVVICLDHWTRILSFLDTKY